MTLTELRSMTVIQLRKFARENHIVLGAGVEKAAMIEKIVHTLHLEDAPQQQSFLDLPEFADQEGVPDESSSEPAPELSETVPDYTDAVAEDLRAAEENLTDDSVSESSERSSCVLFLHRHQPPGLAEHNSFRPASYAGTASDAPPAALLRSSLRSVRIRSAA